MDKLTYLIEQATTVEKKLDELRAILDRVLGFTPVLPDTSKLSPQETKIFRYIGERRKIPEIAAILGLARKTIEAHRYNIQVKLQATSSYHLKQIAEEMIKQAKV